MPGGQFRVRVRVRVRVTVRVRVRASYCDRSAQTYSYLSPSPVLLRSVTPKTFSDDHLMTDL